MKFNSTPLNFIELMIGAEWSQQQASCSHNKPSNSIQLHWIWLSLLFGLLAHCFLCCSASLSFHFNQLLLFFSIPLNSISLIIKEMRVDWWKKSELFEWKRDGQQPSAGNTSLHQLLHSLLFFSRCLSSLCGALAAAAAHNPPKDKREKSNSFHNWFSEAFPWAAPTPQTNKAIHPIHSQRMEWNCFVCCLLWAALSWLRQEQFKINSICFPFHSKQFHLFFNVLITVN